MYIQLILSKPRGDGRQQAKIQLILTGKEDQALQDQGITTLECKTPMPVACYSHETPKIRSVTGVTLENGMAWKGYFIPKFPKSTMARPIPRKTALRIPIESKETNLGWVNQMETNSLLRWWETAKEEFTKTQEPGANPTAPQEETEFFQASCSSNTEVKTNSSQKPSISKRRGLQILP